MEFLVLAWFVLIQTESAFLVSVYGALRFTGTLFSPFYGIVIDRYDRKKLITGARLAFSLMAGVIILLAFSGGLEVWHVFVITAVSGMLRAFDNVTRQTLIGDLVSRDTLHNAIALTRTGRDATQILGPLIGGILLDQYGLGVTYILVLALYLIGAGIASQLKPPARTPTGVTTSVMSNLFETFRYVKKEQVILALLLMAFLVNLTGFPLNLGLMPIFAKDVLNTDATGLGQLLSAYSAGALVGSVVIAGIPNVPRLGRLMVLGSIGWHLGILVISLSKWFVPSMVILLFTGAAQSFSMVTMAILLIGSTSTDIRGRVMGLRSWAVYGLPMGLLMSGAIAENASIQAALVINGVVGILLTFLVVARLPGVWRGH